MSSCRATNGKAFAAFRLAFDDHMKALDVEPEPVAPSPGPALRPHAIPGWWQVWSGSICVALLRPEDVAHFRLPDDHPAGHPTR